MGSRDSSATCRDRVQSPSAHQYEYSTARISKLQFRTGSVATLQAVEQVIWPNGLCNPKETGTAGKMYRGHVLDNGLLAEIVAG